MNASRVRSLIAALIAYGVTSCSFRPHSVTITPDLATALGDVPAGDDVHLTARLWSYSDELTPKRQLYAFGGWSWHLSLGSPPPVASFTLDRVLHAHVPGTATISAGARGVGESVHFRVVWPLDSIELRFVARVVHVGDTVELLHRAHFVSGEVANESFRAYYAGADGREPAYVDHTPARGWRAIRFDLAAVEWFQEPLGSLGDTALYVARYPGIFRIGGVFYNRWVEDTLRIEPASGAPRSYRQRPLPPAHARASAFACYTLDVGRWTFNGSYKWPSNWPPPARLYDFVPRTIALDTAALIPRTQGVGYRLDAVGGPALKIGRHWRGLTADSVWILMESAKEYPRAHNRTGIILTLGLADNGRLISGVAEDVVDADELRAPVTGKRIPCH